AMPDVRIMPRTTVFGTFDGGVYGALQRVSDHVAVPPPHQPRQRLWRIMAKRALLAAGATERPIVFGGNDRPGVMLASALRTYQHRYAVLPGRRIAIFTDNDDGWHTAADLTGCNVEVTAVIDSRTEIAPRVTALAGSARAIVGAKVTGTHGRAG